MIPCFTPLSILATGAVTAVGLTAPRAAAAVRAGIAGFGGHPYLVDSAGDPMVVAAVPGLPLAGVDAQRFVDMALPAAREALAVLQPSSRLPVLPIALGFPRSRPGISAGLPQEVANRLTRSLADRCRVSGTAVFATGHAAGLMALEECGRMMLERGSEFGLAGAADSYIDAVTLEWLEAEGQLHTPADPWGFIPGEAAAFCLLATPAGIAAIDKAVSLRIQNVTVATESSVIKTDAVCTGQGLTRAIRGALDALPVGAKADDIICDLNGEPYRADEYGFTVPRIAERCSDAVAFQNPADCWGDVGAASGVLFVILAAASAQKRYARGPHALLWTSSEGGERAAALAAAPQ